MRIALFLILLLFPGLAHAATEEPAALCEWAAQQAAAESGAAERAAAERATQQAAKPAATSNDLRAISTPSPGYPRDAYRDRASGEVQVEFTVGTDGSVTSARVVRADPPRVFDREAVAAVRRWRFEPVPAPVTTRRTINFASGD